MEYIIDQQFYLSYFCNMTWVDTQNMLPFEREMLTNRLLKQQEYEKKQLEDAQNNIGN